MALAMTRRRTVAVSALLASTGLLATCRDQAPQPTATPAPPAATTLPSGHPPIAGSGHPPAGATPPGLPPGHPSLSSSAPPADPATAISGVLSVAPSFASRVSSKDTLFLIARRASDQQIVGVRREDSVTFPFVFAISSADAMTEGSSFSGPIDLTARLSKSGDAMPGKGDLEGVAKGVAPGTKGVKITLDSVRQ
jgi:hypothetical protein